MEINSWFECKVVMDEIGESGMPQKGKPKSYLVDAFNFTEAEARVLEEVAPFSSGETEVRDIKRVKYSEMFTCDLDSADKWYKVKCNMITIDEKKGVEKKTANYMLVQACNFQHALECFLNGMKTSMIDYEIACIQETSIFDVFPFRDKGDKRDDKPEMEAQA